MIATISRSNTRVNENSSAVDTVTRASMIAMSAFSGMVGVWAAACFIGVLAANGPAGILRGLATALIGM